MDHVVAALPLLPRDVPTGGVHVCVDVAQLMMLNRVRLRYNVLVAVVVLLLVVVELRCVGWLFVML